MLRKILLIFLFIILNIGVSAAGVESLKLLEVKDGFNLYFDNKLILTHHVETPCIYVGKGNSDIDMYRGNFNIDENIVEKIGLSDFSITHTDKDVFTVSFSKKEISSMKVLFKIEDSRLTIEFLDYQKDINRLWLRLAANTDEFVYGMGEQFSYFNLRGHHFPVWTAEQGVGRNKDTYVTFLAEKDDKAGGDYYSTYFPLPTFVSSKKYFLHVDGSFYMDFDFRNSNYHELYMWGIPEKIVLNSADSYVDLIVKLTDFFGRQPELPDWVYDGVILGIQGGIDTVLNKLKTAVDSGVNVSGLWVQDWVGKRVTSFGKRLMWNWEYNSDMYPELEKEIKKLKEKGVRFFGYINPYIAIEGNLFKDAKKKGYLGMNSDGEVYLIDFGEFDAGVVDLTKPDAADWYKDVIKNNLIGVGLNGWMADFGEYLPTDILLYNGISAEIMHNEWPALWAKINYDAISESGKLGDIVYFMRAGYTGSQKYCTLVWAGDQFVDWSLDDGIASVIPAALSLGMSGHGLHHSDIGGYTSLFGIKRTKELFMRWTEFAAFTPVMRTHEGNRPDKNWQFDSDKETLLHFARMSTIYKHLKPYLKELVKENAEYGIPVMRPIFMHYEDDLIAHNIKYEYLLGRDLLVAPVYKSEATKWNVYLPDDEWIHLWTGKAFSGGNIEIESPIGEPPVFYRKNSKFLELFKSLKFS